MVLAQEGEGRERGGRLRRLLVGEVQVHQSDETLGWQDWFSMRVESCGRIGGHRLFKRLPFFNQGGNAITANLQHLPILAQTETIQHGTVPRDHDRVVVGEIDQSAYLCDQTVYRSSVESIDEGEAMEEDIANMQDIGVLNEHGDISIRVSVREFDDLDHLPIKVGCS